MHILKHNRFLLYFCMLQSNKNWEAQNKEKIPFPKQSTFFNVSVGGTLDSRKQSFKISIQTVPPKGWFLQAIFQFQIFQSLPLEYLAASAKKIKGFHQQPALSGCRSIVLLLLQDGLTPVLFHLPLTGENRSRIRSREGKYEASF